MSFKKGDIVTVNEKMIVNTLLIPIWRALTSSEIDSWFKSDASKGMTSAGETILPPETRHKSVALGELFIVKRARVRATKGSREVGMCMEVIDSEGQVWFAKQKHMKHVVQ